MELLDAALDFLWNLHLEEMPQYQIAIYGAFLLMFFVQIFYYLGRFRKATTYSSKREKKGVLQKPMSLVICTTNEYLNLSKNLPLLLQQHYPRFEVIVVSDCSTDSTEELLYTLKQQYPHLQYSTIEPDNKFRHDRKLAITLAVKAAKYDAIMFTEADCVPPNNMWLANIQPYFDDDTEFVIGYCKYQHRSGIFNKLLRSDSIYTSLFALSNALDGKPFKSTFKNFGMSQKAFFQNKGFAHINSYRNSEETLFLCRNANAKNTAVALRPGSIMTSMQQPSFKQWWLKRLTQSALLSMGKRGQFAYLFEMGSRVLFYLLALVLLVLSVVLYNPLTAIITVPILAIRFLVQINIYNNIRKVWQEKNIFWGLFFYDLLFPWLAFVIALAKPNLQKIKKIK